MREGWSTGSYFLVLDPREVRPMTEAYGIDAYLPGYRLVAIRGWDDFIVENANGELFIVPTVPLREKDLTPLPGTPDWADLQPDERITGKVKWYIKPIVFGGDPGEGPNMTWIDHSTHQKAVRYWNDLYRDVEGKIAGRDAD
jgi:hypothetical protein